ncbi:glycosyltransferase [Synechococcus sp. WH 8020]|uniref:glycosyltransferase n=1 Tax=Synechococcus sp. (strain WH8020) TaxID=32052 RepID=UPI0008FFC332|nr:glycosyltransferase [Synechococcus sp. WH 8020]
MLSRVLADKGVREFVEAAKIVKKVYPNVAFSYGGFLDSLNPTSISESEFRSWVDSDIFEYLGDLSSNDVIIALNKCKFYVLPSYREGTPRSVLEAMALGRPILTTDVPGCRETVVDGLNGFLVPARDPDALANGMIRLIKQSEEDTVRMASNSLKLVKARFDVRKVNTQIIGLLCL